MKKSFLYNSLKNTKLNIFFMVLLSIVSSYLITLIPMYIKYALDGVVYNSDDSIPSYISYFFYDKSFQSKLLVICIFLLIINLIISLIKYFRSKTITNFNIKLNKNVKKAILNQTTDLEYQSFLKIDNSKIVQRVNIDTNTYTSFFDYDITFFIDMFFISLFSIINAFSISVPIGIFIVICIIIYLIASIIFFRRSTVLAKIKVETNEKVISKINNNIKNIRTIKMYGKEEAEKKSFFDMSLEYKKVSSDLLNCSTRYHSICHVINVSKNAFVITIGGVLIIKGSLSFGGLAALLQYTSSAIESFSKAARKFRNIPDFYVAYKRLNAFMYLKTDQPDLNIDLKGDIVFKNVSIKLDNSTLLHDLNFTLKEGNNYALVGDNGTGKSILIKTIFRLYDYDGDIYIGSINLKDINSRTISRNVGLVLQEPFLFNSTVEDNICLNNSNEGLIEISKLCDIYDDVMKFDNKFKTIINDNLNLSGGQKQRLCIARALMQNKKYLFFDDSFSKLDVLTRNKILENIRKMNITTINATYDYFTAKKMENILFINNGTIISGLHGDLEVKNEDYKRLMQVSKNILGDDYE